MSNLTQAQLKDILKYIPETGEFIWKQRGVSKFKDARAHKIWHTRYCGEIAGSLTDQGYISIWINGHCRAHRLAWLYMTGEFPLNQIDHIDHDRSNNVFSNLRVVAHRINSLNQKKRSTNTSGVTGVAFIKRLRQWRAQITVNGDNVHIGCFKDFFDACCARKSAEFKLGFHANHGI